MTIDWRSCTWGAVLAALVSLGAVGRSWAQAPTLVYAAIGAELRDYELDPKDATLTLRSSLQLPAEITAGSPHVAGRSVYVAWSDATNVTAGSNHGLSAIRVDPTTLALSNNGPAVTLASRPIYINIDPSAQYVLVAYTNPTGVTVHRIGQDGIPGAAISQPTLKLGVYGHQILVDPTSSMALLVARGNVPNANRAEDPGALNVLSFENGLLKDRGTVAPNGGIGFHPRYVDFHPSHPWVYVSLSQQNELAVYARRPDGTLSADRLFEKNSLADPEHTHPGQLTGALRVHPNGRFVYLANRATGATQVDGKPVFSGGENSIAVFAVDLKTGEPVLIQNVATRGVGPVELAIDPSGRNLVVANMMRLPSLTVFRIGSDGKLEIVRKYDVDSGDRTLFWMGMTPAPAAEGQALTDLQRSYQMDRYTELAAQGPARGENIYFYKCFVCHNHYAKGGPPLQGLFLRGRSNDAVVANVIRNGGVTMPGFGHSLSNADVSDLLSYLKNSVCCYEANDPPVNPQYLAAAHHWPVPGGLRGGAHGRVLASDGSLLEGIKIQLIAPNGVRTTVSTNADGVFEFPVMQAGEYRLRIATPLTFEPYQRDRVRIAQNNSIDDIVLREVSQTAPGALPGALPANEEIAAQLSGAELLWNLPGSLYEKTAFMRTCGIGCHDLKQILRNRFDERGWRSIVTWMTSRGSASVFVVRPTTPVLTPDAERVVQWLTRVRGPGSRDDPYRAFPRPSGPATDVVITEYELPHRFLSIHEVDADSKGHIWYTSHRTPYVGQLDPRTGIVTDYKVPDIPGMFPGTYKVAVDRNKNLVWFSQNWAHRLTQLDPATGRFKQLLINIRAPFNAGPWGNFGLAPDGTIWSEYDDNTIVQLDGTSGTILKSYPLSRNPNPADDLISADGRYWAGGAPTMGNNTGMILDIRSGTMYETNSGGLPSSAARGGFDRSGNAWFGGHTGSFVEIVNEIDRGKGIHMRTFTPPTPYFPYSNFYSAMPDASGNIWGAWVHGRGFVRLDPGSGTWRVYDNPEPSAFARSTWVDNSTTPATVWYPDYQMGTLVRIQPRD